MFIKNKLPIILILILLVGLAVGWYFFGRSNQQLLLNMKVKQEPRAQEKVIIEQENNYQSLKKPAEKNDINLCPQQEQLAYDQCIFAVASTNNNWQLCPEIKDEKLKLRCTELSELRNNEKAGEFKLCEKFTIKEFHEQCLIKVATLSGDLAICNQLKTEDKGLCNDTVYRVQAQTQKDFKLCDKINDSVLKFDCQLALQKLPLDSDHDGLSDTDENAYGTNAFKADTDGDGLSDYEELSKYHTDPTKADTDGDGYNDNQEIKYGYDAKVK